MTCDDHECDRCPTCLAGRCCGEDVVDANLPDQGSWPGPHHAPLGELLEDGEGRLICHACGRGADALYAHLRAHRLRPDEYRAYFGLRVGEPLASERLRASRRRDTFEGERNTTPPSLTREQRSEITRNREQRLQAQRSGRHDPEQQREWARRRGARTDEERARMRHIRRREDPGHACPECGALVCTWTGRASGYSTKRTLCGERDCLRSARSRAAVVANRKRWASPSDQAQ